MSSDWVLPALIAGVLGWGLVRGTPVYDSFVRGAGRGVKTAVSVLPCLVAVMVAVEMMKASGALDLLCGLLAGPLELIGIPPEAAPLVVVRPFSGMASLSMLDDLYRRLGPDSIAARVASTIMGCTETVFYTVAVYFGSVGIKNTRHTIPAALISMLAGVVMSGMLCRFF
jgi:spore maturation protein B